MGNFDRAMAQRVWQRVQSAQPEIPVVPAQPAQQLQSWILEEWQTAQRYIALRRQISPKQTQPFDGLLKEKQAQISCLKGIYRMVAGTQPKLAGIPPKQEPVEISLRKCYGSLMRCMAQYEGAARDPEYGGVYSQLAQENKRHCHSILTFLGNMRK